MNTRCILGTLYLYIFSVEEGIDDLLNTPFPTLLGHLSAYAKT